MIPKATLMDSASLNSILLSSGKMFRRQAGHCEQREAVLSDEPEAERSLILPNALLSLHVLYLQGMEMSALRFLVFLMDVSWWLSVQLL